VVAFQPNEAHSYHLLSHWPLHPAPGRQMLAHQPYPAADLDEQTAELTVRDWAGGSRTPIPRARWRFARDEHGRLEPVADDRYVWLDGGFQPGRWYEVTYTTRVCPIVGTGLLATRDCVAWLRHAAAPNNPAAGRLDFTYGTGRSQCGRFLRHFLYEGFNLDEDGRQVFDGLMPHVAGARRGEFNQRYGQPSETNPSGSGGLFPFASDTLTDPATGRTDGLLRRQRELGGVPRIFTTNTSSEYWRSDCSLIHTDPSGQRDIEPPAEERIYLIASHQHGAGLPLLTDTTPIGARGANPFNVVDGSPAERALLVRLDRWVSQGVAPPPSAFPRLADGTAVARETILEQFRFFSSTFAGAALLDPRLLPRLRRPDQAQAQAHEYPSYAPAVDADGNELAGIRVPELAVPVATYTGWNLFNERSGPTNVVSSMQGSFLPLAPTRVERDRINDPRPSISERYASREQYLERIGKVARDLVERRYLLNADVSRIIEQAGTRWDYVMTRDRTQ
jgi:hypothetical protein